MERCPGCNARLRERVVCSRCQADLTVLINSEKAAQWWLVKSVHDWSERKTEPSINALCVSIALKKTSLAIVFRDFIIQKNCQTTLDLLAQKQCLTAKHQLYKVRLLLPYSQQLQQMNAFTDYLLAKT